MILQELAAFSAKARYLHQKSLIELDIPSHGELLTKRNSREETVRLVYPSFVLFWLFYGTKFRLHLKAKITFNCVYTKSDILLFKQKHTVLTHKYCKIVMLVVEFLPDNLLTMDFRGWNLQVRFMLQKQKQKHSNQSEWSWILSYPLVCFFRGGNEKRAPWAHTPDPRRFHTVY